MQENRTQIKISDVLELIRIGKTREEIRIHYELSKGELVELFKHPQLKGRRTRTPISFEIVDDVSAPQENVQEEVEVVQETTQEEVRETTQEEVQGDFSINIQEEVQEDISSNWAN